MVRGDPHGTTREPRAGSSGAPRRTEAELPHERASRAENGGHASDPGSRASRAGPASCRPTGVLR